MRPKSCRILPEILFSYVSNTLLAALLIPLYITIIAVFPRGRGTVARRQVGVVNGPSHTNRWIIPPNGSFVFRTIIIRTFVVKVSDITGHHKAVR